MQSSSQSCQAVKLSSCQAVKAFKLSKHSSCQAVKAFKLSKHSSCQIIQAVKAFNLSNYSIASTVCICACYHIWIPIIELSNFMFKLVMFQFQHLSCFIIADFKSTRSNLDSGCQPPTALVVEHPELGCACCGRPALRPVPCVPGPACLTPILCLLFSTFLTITPPWLGPESSSWTSYIFFFWLVMPRRKDLHHTSLFYNLCS